MQRQFTIDQRRRGRDVAMLTASILAAPPLVQDPHAHNVGDCGCGGGGCSGGAMICPNPLSGGNLVIPGDVFTSNPGPTVNAPPSGPGVTIQQLRDWVAQLPAGLRPDLSQDTWARVFAAARQCRPYEDATRDCNMMSLVASDPNTIATGVTEDIDIQPDQGILDVYYIDVSIRTAAGAALPPEAISITPPRVVGCPAPACSNDVATSGRFYQGVTGCCCGRPFRAVIPRTSEGTPLRMAVTNHTAADAVVQVAVRGICTSTRWCS